MTVVPVASPRRVFLHVGSPKTGTTFLQQVLWSQRGLAREQGLLLPGERFFDHFLASLDVRGLAGRPEHSPRAVGMWKRMVAQAAAWHGDVLISHELFAAATAEQAERAVAAFGSQVEVHVVLTARDLVRQIPAEWQEHVKHRSSRTLPRFVADLRADTAGASWFWKVQDFADIVGRWGRALPPERVHVVTVPPAGADPGTLWTRFATLVGLNPAAFDTDTSRANTSLGVEQAELLRRINAELGDRLPLPGPYPLVVKDVLAHRILAARAGTRLVLDVPATEFAVERSEHIAGRLRALGVDVVGDLAELVPDREAALTAARETAYADPSDGVLLTEGVAALAGLLDAFGTERRARRQLQEAMAQSRRAPVRFVLARASEVHPVLGRARRAYRRARDVAGRVRRR